MVNAMRAVCETDDERLARDSVENPLALLEQLCRILEFDLAR